MNLNELEYNEDDLVKETVKNLIVNYETSFFNSRDCRLLPSES